MLGQLQVELNWEEKSTVSVV